MWPSRDNLKAITKYPKPTMYTAIKGFVGLVGHCRCFIKDFTRIANSLHEYVRGDTTKKKKEQVVLNEVARNAFLQLKKAVMSALVLAYPDSNKEYLLKTDALKLRLGAMLSQKQSNGRYQTQVFGHEVFYRTFPDLLVGPLLQVCTDNNPLTYFLTSPNMDSMKQKWINELVKYNFSLKYQKGKNNTVADALSRISEECLSDEEAEKVLKAVPMIPKDNTVFEVFEEKEEDR